MTGGTIKLSDSQVVLVRQCYDIAARFVNLKQVKAEVPNYENEFEKAGCRIYSLICFCVEKEILDFTDEMARGFLIGLSSSYLSGKLPQSDIIEHSAAELAELICREQKSKFQNNNNNEMI